MAQYASIFDFKTLGLPAKMLANVDDATIDQHLIKAGGKIDNFLRQAGYVLPLSGTLGTATTPSTGFPDEIISANVCLARWPLMIWLGYRPDDHDDNYEKSYDKCVAWLSSGNIGLDAAADADTVVAGRPLVSTKPMRGWNTHNDEALT